MVAQAVLSHANDVRSKRTQLRMELISEEYFPGIDLAEKYLEGVYLPNRVFYGARICDTNLRKASLQFCNLKWANLDRSKLNGCDLSGANMEKASLVGTNLSCADLTDAAFRDANLSKANLSNAVLFHTDFSGADLSGANLSGVTAIDCIFDGATLPAGICTDGWVIHYDEKTRWPEGVEPPEIRQVELADITSMDLLAYLQYRKDQT